MSEGVIYYVCDENGSILREYYDKDYAFESCNWGTGEFVSIGV
jgi:hypothetical protein